MKRRIAVTVLIAAVMLILATGMALAQDKTKPGEAPLMTAEEQAMMERMMKLAQPGPQHALLAKTAGKWTYSSTMYGLDPSAPPTKSSGTSEREMILGGRYLMEKDKGDFNGMPFEGIGITGYDNAQQKYINYWIDNFGTMMMTGLGTADPTGKVITIVSTYDDPMTGQKNVTMRQALTIKSDDEMVFELYGNQHGKESKMVEMVLKRVK